MGNKVRLEAGGNPMEGTVIPFPENEVRNVQVVAW